MKKAGLYYPGPFTQEGTSPSLRARGGYPTPPFGFVEGDPPTPPLRSVCPPFPRSKIFPAQISASRKNICRTSDRAGKISGTIRPGPKSLTHITRSDDQSNTGLPHCWSSAEPVLGFCTQTSCPDPSANDALHDPVSLIITRLPDHHYFCISGICIMKFYHSPKKNTRTRDAYVLPGKCSDRKSYYLPGDILRCLC